MIGVIQGDTRSLYGSNGPLTRRYKESPYGDPLLFQVLRVSKKPCPEPLRTLPVQTKSKNFKSSAPSLKLLAPFADNIVQVLFGSKAMWARSC